MKTKIVTILAILALSACSALKTNGAKVCEQLDTTQQSVEQAFAAAKTTCLANDLPTHKED